METHTICNQQLMNSRNLNPFNNLLIAKEDDSERISLLFYESMGIVNQILCYQLILH